MAASAVCTPDTLLRKLKLTTVKSFARVLDIENELALDWRDFAQRLPKRPGSSEMRYKIRDIEYLAHKQKTSGKSPTETILSDLGTLNTRVKDIVSILEDMNHLEAIGILLPDHAVRSSDQQTRRYQDEAPEFKEGKICEYTVGEVAALTANFNATSLSDGGRQIGRGGFGVVFLGLFKDGTKCAVKRLVKEDLDPNFNIMQQMKTEADTLQNLQHVNLVRIYGYCWDNLSLVLEYVSGGNLAQRLACEDNRQPLSWRSRVTIATAAARGIAFLHEMKCVHRDIKSANILIDGNLVPKIADFGLVRQLEGEKTTQYTSIVIMSIIYLAPECRTGQFSYKSDVYSFGVVLLEIITGLPVLDRERVGQDIITYLEEVCEVEDAILDVVDKKSSPYVDRQVKLMYRLANQCLEGKRDRPLMQEVYDTLVEIG